MRLKKDQVVGLNPSLKRIISESSVEVKIEPVKYKQRSFVQSAPKPVVLIVKKILANEHRLL
jgi:hypothetical protein